MQLDTEELDRIAALLRCPRTGAALRRVRPRRLATLNREIGARRWRTEAGGVVTESLVAAVACPDEAYVYRVESGIFHLLPALALTARSDARPGEDTAAAGAKRGVQAFYDRVGWRVRDGGEYEDAERFEDLRPVADSYVQAAHRRVGRALPARGRYLLDAACGPIQYDAYLAYSAAYERRICVDISLVALERARGKLGGRGIYLLCDVTQLPLADGVVDAFVSLHTVYHVPAAEQTHVVRELYRVLAPGGRGAIVYSWGERAALMHPVKALRRRLSRLTRAVAGDRIVDFLRGHHGAREGDAPSPTSDGAPALYFHAHDYAWFRKNLGVPLGAELTCWRSVSVPFAKRFVPEGRVGARIFAALHVAESTAPRFFGRYGQYPIFILRK